MDVYYFDTHQKLIGVINEEHIIDAHLTKKINQGSTMSIEIVSRMALPEDARYMLIRDPDGDEYLMFTIQNRKYKQETVTYTTMEYAWEQLTNRGLVKDYRPSGKSVRSVLQDILINYSADNDNWEIRKCNIDTSVNTNFYYLTRTECLTKLVEVIGKGELEFHVDFDGNKIVKTYIDFMAEIGSSNVSYWFEWEKNLIEVTNTSDESEIYASIVPRGKGELVSEGQDGSPDGYGRRIGIEDISWSKSNGDPLDKKKGLDTLTDHEVSNKYGRSYRLVIFEDIDDPKQLIRAAYRELKKHNHKQVQYSASVLDGQTVQLGDHVVIRKPVGHEIAYETRVFMIEYDLLRPQNTRISLGDDLTQDSLSQQISNIGKAIDSVANNTNWGFQNTDGSKTFYSDKEPVNAKEGDLWFKQLPNGEVEIWRFENGSWQMVLNQNIGDDIQKQVDDALKSAKEYSGQLNQKTQDNINQVQKIVDDNKNATDSAFDKANSKIEDANTNLTNLKQSTGAEINRTKSDIDNLRISMNDIGQVNQLFNTEFTPDLENWEAPRTKLDGTTYKGSNVLEMGNNSWILTKYQLPVVPGTKIGIMVDVFVTGNRVIVDLFDKETGKIIPSSSQLNTTLNKWVHMEKTFIVPVGFDKVNFRIYSAAGAKISRPMFVYDAQASLGNYVPGNYNNKNQIASVQKGLDGLTATVKDNTGALSAVKLQADKLTTEVRNNKNDVESKIIQTNGSIAAEVKNRVSAIDTVIQQTDSRITSTVKDYTGKITTLNQRIDGFDTKVSDTNSKLESLRTQTSDLIAQEVRDRQNGDSSTLSQAKNAITLAVQDKVTKSELAVTTEGIYMNVSRQNLLVDPSLIEEDKWWNNGFGDGRKNSTPYNWFYTPSNRSHGVPSLAVIVTDDTTTGYTWKSSQAIDIKYGFENLYINFDAKTGVGEKSTDYFIVYAAFMNSAGKLINTLSVIGKITSNNNIKDWQSFSKKVPIPDDASSMKLVYQLSGKGIAMVSRPYVGLGELEKGQYITGPLQTTNTVLGLFKDNFVLGIKDNVGNIISGINGDTSGLAITGKKVAINGDTTVNGDFWTKNVNAVKVNASNITAGTIDANKVNIVNLTANQIKTGTLQGININVNKILEIATGGLIKWNTDAVIRGYSDNPFYWQGVGDGKFSVVDIAEKGSVKMDTTNLITLEGQLKAPENTSKKYLGKMWTHSTGPASNSAFGRNRISSTGIELQIYENKPLDGVDVSYVTSINANGINMGTAYVRPRISLSASSGTISGRRVRLSSDVASLYNFDNQMTLSYAGRDGNTPPRFQIESYDGNTPTVSYSANMYMTRAGAIYKTSSKRAKKTNIQHDFTLEQANALVDLQPATWHDKAELERTDDAPLVPVRHFGMVAEELEQAGLSQLVEYDEYGNVMSISYDRLAIALIPAIKSLRERVGELEYKLTKTKEN